ncbi:MAG: MFS transporter (plasmid) [Leptolyngbya sp. BL-A-14]
MRPALTLRQTFLYSATSVGINLINTTVSTWLLYCYAPPPNTGRSQALSIVVVGTLLALGRVWNAVIDPFIGHWSDVSRSRWGRRAPFLVAGSLLNLITLLCLWTPPTAQPSLLNGLYFLALTIAFYTGLSLVGVPYDGSLPEVATTAVAQVNLSMWKNIFGIAGVLGSAVLGSVIYDRWGPVAMGGVMGVIGLATVGLTVRVLPADIPPTAAPMGLRQSLRCTLRNRPFLSLCGSTILVQTAYAMLLANLPYFVTLVLHEPEAAVGRFQGIVVIAMLVAAPGWNWLSRHYLNRQLLQVSLLGLALSSSLLAAVGWLPHGSIGLQALVCFGLLGPFLGGYFVLVYALMAAVVEQDAWVTGQRREAFHYSIFAFAAGLGLSLSTLLVSPLFSYYGYTAEHPVGIRLVFLAAAVLVLLGAWVFRGYRLSDALTEAPRKVQDASERPSL